MDRIAGFVDGFDRGVLRGWLVNLDNPLALEPLVLRDQDGREVEFTTCHYRSDVCRVHKMQGLFGFAVKREWLDGSSRSVTVFDRRGAVVSGGRGVKLPELRPQEVTARRGPLDIFIHVPKTGGTSVRLAVTKQMDQAERLLIYPNTGFAVSEEIIGLIPLHQRQHLRLAIGHCKFGVHEQLGVPSKYSIFIRDPATRLRSNFAHHGAHRTVFEIGGNPVDVATVINEGLSDEFDNLMVRLVAGLSDKTRPAGTVCEADVDLALHNIREHFRFVGLYETIRPSFAGLCEALGVGRPNLAAENVSPKVWPGSERQNASIRWRTVRKRNRHDFALYKAIRQEGLVGRIA